MVADFLDMTVKNRQIMLMFCGRHIARPLNDLTHRHNTAVYYPVEISPIPTCQRQFGHCNQCSGPSWCASGCVVECRICNQEFAGSNLGLGYFAPQSLLSRRSLRGR